MAFNKDREGGLPVRDALTGNSGVPQRVYMEWPDDVCRPRNRLSLLCGRVSTPKLETNQVDPKLFDEANEM